MMKNHTLERFFVFEKSLTNVCWTMLKIVEKCRTKHKNVATYFLKEVVWHGRIPIIRVTVTQSEVNVTFVAHGNRKKRGGFEKMFLKEDILHRIRKWLAFKKISIKYKYTSEEKKMLEEWNQQMERTFQWDSQFHDFSISDDWDEDFHAAMEKGIKEGERKRKMMLNVAACGAAALVVIGVTEREVIGDGLKKVFCNESNEGGSEHIYFGTKEEISILEDSDRTRLDYEEKTIADVYLQIKEKLKRPIFQISDEFEKYEMIDAYYEEALELIVIVLETQEGKIYLSQEERLNDGGTGAGHEDEKIVVWNENLQQNITISKSIQDNSCSFFVEKSGAIFNFFGYLSEENCCKIAENLLFQ